MENEKFKLWKLALSSIHIDGKVTDEEIEWFQKSLENLANNKILDFSPEQIEDLRNCLRAPAVNFLEDFKKLQSPSDCSQLLHIIRVVSHVDNHFSDDEQALYKKLEAACLENVDLEAIEAKVVELENMSYHEDEVYKVNNEASYFEKGFKSILKILKS